MDLLAYVANQIGTFLPERFVISRIGRIFLYGLVVLSIYYYWLDIIAFWNAW
jgi:hypothetical protein